MFGKICVLAVDKSQIL